MVKLVVFETDSKEEDLFFGLVSRGRWDLPYYFSVSNYDWKSGIVLFTMLCCSPSPTMKVGIAGNLIITSGKNVGELKTWLGDWGIKFKQKIEKDFSSPEEAQIFHKELREKFPKKERQEAGERVEKRIQVFFSTIDKDFLAM